MDNQRSEDQKWQVELPADAEPPFEVYLNGVSQQESVDFDHRGRYLYFRREIAQEGKLGFWRWLSIFLGIAGTYRKNDSVDIAYTADGVRKVASGLKIVEPGRDS